MFEDGVIDELGATPICRNTSECGLGFSSVSAIRENRYKLWCLKGDPVGCFGKIMEDGWKMNY